MKLLGRAKVGQWRFALPLEQTIIRGPLPMTKMAVDVGEVRTPPDVYTLIVEVGRSRDDGLPKDATGATLMCYSSGVNEAEAVHETVAVLKVAGMAPLEVSSYGTLKERIAEGHDISNDETDLMQRAIGENSVIIAQLTPFYDD